MNIFNTNKSNLTKIDLIIRNSNIDQLFLIEFSKKFFVNHTQLTQITLDLSQNNIQIPDQFKKVFEQQQFLIKLKLILRDTHLNEQSCQYIMMAILNVFKQKCALSSLILDLEGCQIREQSLIQLLMIIFHQQSSQFEEVLNELQSFQSQEIDDFQSSYNQIRENFQFTTTKILDTADLKLREKKQERIKLKTIFINISGQHTKYIFDNLIRKLKENNQKYIQSTLKDFDNCYFILNDVFKEYFKQSLNLEDFQFQKNFYVNYDYEQELVHQLKYYEITDEIILNLKSPKDKKIQYIPIGKNQQSIQNNLNNKLRSRSPEQLQFEQQKQNSSESSERKIIQDKQNQPKYNAISTYKNSSFYNAIQSQENIERIQNQNFSQSITLKQQNIQYGSKNIITHNRLQEESQLMNSQFSQISALHRIKKPHQNYDSLCSEQINSKISHDLPQKIFKEKTIYEFYENKHTHQF